MVLNHIHLRIRDLNAAVTWFEEILQVPPASAMNEWQRSYSTP